MGMAKVPLANGAIGERAEQGARANDHGCHVSCSEQHEPRQPRSWLILNVRQMTTSKVKALVECAFAGVTLGPGVSLRQAEVMDNYGEGCTDVEFVRLPL